MSPLAYGLFLDAWSSQITWSVGAGRKEASVAQVGRMDTASNASDPAKAVETWPYDLSRTAGAGCERRGSAESVSVWLNQVDDGIGSEGSSWLTFSPCRNFWMLTRAAV